MEDRPVEVELQRQITAPRTARALVRNQFSGKLSDDELETATLLVSELVTNAVRYGRGRITLRADLDDRRLLVDVFDEGHGPDHWVRDHEFGNPRDGGRGLMIVDAASSSWGILDGTAHVWFELERHGHRVLETRSSATMH